MNNTYNDNHFIQMVEDLYDRGDDFRVENNKNNNNPAHRVLYIPNEAPKII